MSGKKILVVEDETPIRNNLLRLLRMEGYEAEGAANGAEGLSKALQFQPDLLISDLMMPEMDGMALLQAIRQHPQLARLPFVFLSARADRSDFREGMRAGADDYVSKPFTRDDILDAVQSRLQKYQQLASHFREQVHSARQEAHYYMHHDAVTNLPNRLLLRELFDAAIQVYADGVAVLVLGIDRFQAMTQGQSSNFHDGLLRAVGARFAAQLPEAIPPVHLQAGQFVILIEAGNALAVKDRSQSLLASLDTVLDIAGTRLIANVNIGFALAGQDGADIDTLVQVAQLGLAAAQEQGGRAVLRRPTGQPANDHQRRLALETALHEGLAAGEFQLFFHPQVNLQSGRIVGAEALLRWFRPGHGMVSPAEFLPLAEESGAIVPIGEWVLREACRQAQSWRQAGFLQIRVGVNVSGRQFRPGYFVPLVRQVLAETGLPAQQLDLEITESVTMQDIDTCADMLRELADMEIITSLDDFGTGYSSLSYLKRLPFHTLKIDQSFVRRVHDQPQNGAIVRAIVEMGKQLGLHLIAEGVECEHELAYLRRCQVDEIQGFYFSKPLPAADFLPLLLSDRRLDDSAGG